MPSHIYRPGESFSGHGTVISFQLQCHHERGKSSDSVEPEQYFGQADKAAKIMNMEDEV